MKPATSYGAVRDAYKEPILSVKSTPDPRRSHRASHTATHLLKVEEARDFLSLLTHRLIER